MKILDKLLCRKSRLYRIEIRTGDAGAPYWRIVSCVNGEPIAHSETYTRPDACSDTALRVGEDAGFEVRVVSDPKPPHAKAEVRT